ncbi:MAG: hypothetical protein IPN46_13035 [Saprospiraceae bacterium]|nr:hypothetical protein [Saprospiraceae bacterium]
MPAIDKLCFYDRNIRTYVKVENLLPVDRYNDKANSIPLFSTEAALMYGSLSDPTLTVELVL